MLFEPRSSASSLTFQGHGAYAAVAERDSICLRTPWINGGDAEVELEDRSAEPAI